MRNVSAHKVKAEDVQALPWWHSIDLGNGIVTPGKKNTQLLTTEASIAFKYPVAGKTVLDIGAWDGFFSFEAKRRGAARVLAADLRSWSGLNWGDKASFDLARDALGYEIEDRVIDVYDMTPGTIGNFDVVLFLGVLYHLKNPFGALENVASIASEMLVVETRLDATKVRVFVKWLKDQSYPKNFRDAGNFWGVAPGTPPSVIRSRIANVDQTLESAQALLEQRSVDAVSAQHGRKLFDRTDIGRALEFQHVLKQRFKNDLKALGVSLDG